VKGPRRGTRERILEAAIQLFSEGGFSAVTVRDICRAARANGAAVNYHFGDKLALYTEVVRVAIAEIRKTTEAAIEAGQGAPAEEKLRAHIRIVLERLMAEGPQNWIHRLLNWETWDPTPALSLVYEQALRPRKAYLSSIVAELLGCPPTDPRVERCVLSVHGQCLVYAKTPLLQRLVGGEPFELDALARHVAAFSLAGIRATSGG
jgi:AcrR family transcriptional regulator